LDTIPPNLIAIGSTVCGKGKDGRGGKGKGKEKKGQKDVDMDPTKFGRKLRPIATVTVTCRWISIILRDTSV